MLTIYSIYNFHILHAYYIYMFAHYKLTRYMQIMKYEHACMYTLIKDRLLGLVGSYTDGGSCMNASPSFSACVVTRAWSVVW